MKTQKIQIVTVENKTVEAFAPYIISASRATDIPAFYLDKFKEQIKIGYTYRINPFNGKKYYISFKNCRLIVFWSKNPKQLIANNDFFKNKNLNYYVQYTLNDYDTEGLEPNVPSYKERIETFKKLTNKIGFGKVIWRFDPLILTDNISINQIVEKAYNTANELSNYTEKMVFSFADIDKYRKVKSRLTKQNINYKNFTTEEKIYIAKEFSKIGKEFNFSINSCAQELQFDEFGIFPNRCIDDQLIIKHFYSDEVLIKHLRYPEKYQKNILGELPNPNKDKGQRKYCNCIESKDIGTYNTCPHNCVYCYANK